MDSRIDSRDTTQAVVAQNVPSIAQSVPSVVPQRYEPAVDIATLVPHPRNPNEGSVEAIQESMEANGFFGALLVQESTRRILKGHHTAKAAQAEGRTTVPVLWLDVDDEHALRILLADNATAELAIRTPERIASAMAKLVGDPLKGTGYLHHALAPTLPGMVSAARLNVAHVAPAELAEVDGDGEGHGAADERTLAGLSDDVQADQHGICAACGDGEAAEGNGVIEGDGVPLWRTEDGLLCAECLDYRAEHVPADGDPDDPEPNWNGQAEPADIDDDAGDVDGAGDGDDDRHAKPKASDTDRYPLAIVLDKHEMRRWREVKEMLGAGRDKVALMLCVDATREMMQQAAGEERGDVA